MNCICYALVAITVKKNLYNISRFASCYNYIFDLWDDSSCFKMGPLYTELGIFHQIGKFRSRSLKKNQNIVF
jgi:hypothetical protein